MEAIILAGGLGTRLRSVVKDVPKPMAMVNNKPFLYYLLNWLTKFEINRIVFSVGYMYEAIINYFGNEYNNISLRYAVETEPLGTGGAILNALPHIQSENVVIVNGDTYFPIDIDTLYSEHIKMNGVVTISLKAMNNFERYGFVSVDENSNIIQFHEKSYQKYGLINGGIYILKRDFLLQQNFPKQFSFERDILEKEVERNQIKGVQFYKQFLDIGIPEDYNKANHILT